MQDIHLIGSGGGEGRLFGAGGGDRRLRPNHQRHGNGPPALKCPRCESLNTKFCYYNNYNLSQPRYFCKSCRRYWTKGGVLRNVPVGGGCRKKKRSKPKSGKRKPTCNSGVRKSSNSPNSSTDSSSLTATATTTTTTAANTSAITTTTAPVTVPEVSGINSTNSAPTSFHFHEAPNPSFDPPLLDHHSSDGSNIFREIDTLTSLITSSSAALPPEFNISAGISPFRLHHPGRIVEDLNADQQQWLLKDNTPVAVAELSGLPDKITGGGLGSEDWNNCTDQAFFDLTGTVYQSYWNHTQWDDHDYPRQHHAHDGDRDS